MEQMMEQQVEGTHWSETDEEGYFLYTCANCNGVAVRRFTEEEGGGSAAWDCGRAPCGRCRLGMVKVEALTHDEYIKYRASGAAIRYYDQIDG